MIIIANLCEITYNLRHIKRNKLKIIHDLSRKHCGLEVTFWITVPDPKVSNIQDKSHGKVNIQAERNMEFMCNLLVSI